MGGPNISKYLDPPELIFQKSTEIFGPPLNIWTSLANGAVLEPYAEYLCHILAIAFSS